MGAFLARRALFAVITVFAATLIVFTVSRLVGDPLQFMIRPEGYGVSPEALGGDQQEDRTRQAARHAVPDLDRGVLRGDFGKSLLTEKPVIDIFLRRPRQPFSWPQSPGFLRR